jgi:lipopolysaccharide transport system ATP-binding protein
MIKIEGLSKSYKVYNKRSDRLREWLSFGRKCLHQKFWALRDINLEVPKGSAFGIIGMNGAGKSTLLKVLTGTTQASKGSFTYKGRVAALLELGAGFHQELSGRDNVLINGRLLGLSDHEIQTKMGDIQSFCELGDFFDKPVRTYSSGMYIRLAFALASSVDPDVFIIDEALSVGDAYFQQKCLRKIEEFKAKGVTILFVSHDAGAIKMLCDKVALLNKGQLIAFGDPQEMLEQYNALLAHIDGHGQEYSISRSSNPEQGSLTSGNNKVSINKVEIKNQNNQVLSAFETGTKVSLNIELIFKEDIENPTTGIMIRDRLGYDIYGTNTAESKIITGSFKAGEKAIVSFLFDMNVGPGDYTITAAVHASKSHIEECYQWIDRVKTFKILPKPEDCFIGVTYLKPTIQVVKA